jgi:ubiquinone/menaquinone biosynthesis C-methylase UbiE
MYDLINEELSLDKELYYGIEWNANLAKQGKNKGLNIIQGDLNKKMSFDDNTFTCIYGLSLLEHLLNPCQYLKECHRVLAKDGTLVLLTPNISTFFTAAFILLGKMPSSGPHPDSDQLISSEELFVVRSENLQHDTETDTPVHRHLIVFSFRVLKKYLEMAGFKNIRGYGFGLYPFPNFTQSVLEKIDPYHCHQMVFIAKK